MTHDHVAREWRRIEREERLKCLRANACGIAVVVFYLFVALAGLHRNYVVTRAMVRCQKVNAWRIGPAPEYECLFRRLGEGK